MIGLKICKLMGLVTRQFRIDTDVDITLISEDTYLSLPQHPHLTETKGVFRSPRGELVCEGKFQTD